MKANEKDLNRWYSNLEAYKSFVQQNNRYVSEQDDYPHMTLRTWLIYQKRYLQKGTLDATLKAVLDAELPYWRMNVRESTLEIRKTKEKEVHDFVEIYPMFKEYIDVVLLTKSCTLMDIYDTYANPPDALKQRIRAFKSANQRDTVEDKSQLFMLYILTYKAGKVSEITGDMLRIVYRLTTVAAVADREGCLTIENIPKFFDLFSKVLSTEELCILRDVYVNNSILTDVKISKSDGTPYTRERVRQLLNIALDKLMPLFRALVYTVKGEIDAPVYALTASLVEQELQDTVLFAVPLTYFSFSVKTLKFLAAHNLNTLGDLHAFSKSITTKVQTKYTVLNELLILLYGIHTYKGTWCTIYSQTFSRKTKEYYTENIETHTQELSNIAEYVTTVLDGVLCKLDTVRVLNYDVSIAG